MGLFDRLQAGWQGFRMGFAGTLVGNPLLTPMQTADRDRIARYLANLNSYKGYLSRPKSTVQAEDQTKRMRFNLCRPIIHMAAGWVASGLTFKVTADSEEAAQKEIGRAHV